MNIINMYSLFVLNVKFLICYYFFVKKKKYYLFFKLFNVLNVVCLVGFLLGLVVGLVVGGGFFLLNWDVFVDL